MVSTYQTSAHRQLDLVWLVPIPVHLCVGWEWCQTCQSAKTVEWQIWFGRRFIELSPENQCQAWVQPDFKSIFQPVIAKRFKPKAAEKLRKPTPDTLVPAKCVED